MALHHLALHHVTWYYSWLGYSVREQHTLQYIVFHCYLPSSTGEEDQDKERKETSLSLSEQP